MASIAVHREFAACVSGPNVIVYRLGSELKQVCRAERLTPAAVKGDHKVTDSKDGESDQQQQQSAEDTGSDRVLASSFSPSGRYFATCDDYKQLTLWRTGDQWTLVSTRPLTRRCTAVRFTQSEDLLVVGDKSGDVYSFPVCEPRETGTLLMGHVSMLLDLALCGQKDEMIATADRDEKIRVSLLPNAYNIHTFCLGHTEFVSRLLYLRDRDVLLSGSGDGTIRLWDHTTGRQLACASCTDILNTQGQGQSQDESEAGAAEKETEQYKSDVKSLAYDKRKGIVAVAFDRSNTVLLYRLTFTEGCHGFTHIQRLDMSNMVWDVTFDPSGHLWLMTSAEGSTVAVYGPTDEHSEQYSQLKEEEEEENAQLLATVKAINNDWDLFKESLNIESVYAMLHKPRMNSTHRYFERKEKRLAVSGKRKDAPELTSGGQNGNQSAGTKKPKGDTKVDAS